jgi:hypothetical protein
MACGAMGRVSGVVAVPQAVDFCAPEAFVDHFRIHGWVMAPLLDAAGVRALR